MRPHNSTFSLIKAIGILAIVIGHAAMHTPLCTFVYLFHIAIFFFVAGYFFDDAAPAQRGLKPALHFTGRKLKRLYVPYVVFGILFVLLHNTFLKTHIIAFDFSQGIPIAPYDTQELVQHLLRVILFSWYEQPLVTFWFLFGMLTSLIGFFGVSWFCHRISPHHHERVRAAAIGLLTLLAALWLMHPLGIPFEKLMCRTLLLLPLLYLGRLYALFEQRIPLHFVPALLSLIGLITAAAWGHKINVGGLTFGNPLLFIAITCAGCYMTLYFAQTLAARNTRLTRGLDYIGRNTMSIMILHITAFKLVSLLQIWIYGYPIRYLAYHTVIPQHIRFWWLPYTIAGIALPLAAAWLWDRLRPRCY